MNKVGLGGGTGRVSAPDQMTSFFRLTSIFGTASVTTSTWLHSADISSALKYAGPDTKSTEQSKSHQIDEDSQGDVSIARIRRALASCSRASDLSKEDRQTRFCFGKKWFRFYMHTHQKHVRLGLALESTASDLWGIGKHDYVLKRCPFFECLNIKGIITGSVLRTAASGLSRSSSAILTPWHEQRKCRWVSRSSRRRIGLKRALDQPRERSWGCDILRHCALSTLPRTQVRVAAKTQGGWTSKKYPRLWEKRRKKKKSEGKKSF